MGRTGYNVKRETAKTMYFNNTQDPTKIAKKLSVSPSTIRNWIRKGNWKERLNNKLHLDEVIFQQVSEALLIALEQFKKNPENVSIQNLTNLWRQYEKERDPGKNFLNNSIKWCQYLVEYFLERDTDIAREIQDRLDPDDPDGLLRYIEKRIKQR